MAGNIHARFHIDNIDHLPNTDKTIAIGIQLAELDDEISKLIVGRGAFETRELRAAINDCRRDLSLGKRILEDADATAVVTKSKARLSDAVNRLKTSQPATVAPPEQTSEEATQPTLASMLTAVLRVPTSVRKPLSAPTRKCTVCEDRKPVSDVPVMPCGSHHYCGGCLSQLFVESFRDESLFPPRCCKKEINVDQLKGYLSSDIEKIYKEKKIEFTTVDRVYCSKPECSSFILPDNIEGDQARCMACSTLTCRACKVKHHTGPCKKDKNDGMQAVLALAKQEGWKRCYQCSTIVELTRGCNHMTCRCGAEFCYLCGREWKSCGCPAYTRRFIMRDAIALVDRDVRNNPELANLTVAERRHRVRDATRHLRERHDCNHPHWEYVHGRHDCEMCRDDMPVFILECERCRLQVCRRCSLNRLR